MNSHLLLTGATGLLGRYLLRDLLLSNVETAVLVRPSRRTTAEERVEAMMCAWEARLGRRLPRPQVLTGDITHAGLGLSPEDLAWAKQHCDSVLHNAASLTFHGEDRDGEPWRSNVTGVENVLDFCADVGVPDFLHVSTAYVCGLREGRVFETELDVGQELSNDYERSKLEAEKMIRQSSLFNSVTVFRPAIIVGDSKDGFTTTFHGFYHVVRLIWTLAQSPEVFEGIRNEDPEFPRVRITLTGEEAKNFVPVDWVSAAMTELVCNREHYDKTYHLTAPDRITTRTILELLQDLVGASHAEFWGDSVQLKNPTEFERLMYEHLQTYASYWRDDPIFDMTNTKRALPHLPCPEVKPRLHMLASKAVEMNFRYSDPPVPQANRVPVV